MVFSYFSLLKLKLCSRIYRRRLRKSTENLGNRVSLFSQLHFVKRAFKIKFPLILALTLVNYINFNPSIDGNITDRICIGH